MAGKTQTISAGLVIWKSTDPTCLISAGVPKGQPVGQVGTQRDSPDLVSGLLVIEIMMLYSEFLQIVNASSTSRMDYAKRALLDILILGFDRDSTEYYNSMTAAYQEAFYVKATGNDLLQIAFKYRVSPFDLRTMIGEYPKDGPSSESRYYLKYYGALK